MSIDRNYTWGSTGRSNLNAYQRFHPNGGSTDNNGSVGSGALGWVQAGTGLANAFMSYKNYQLANEQFGFSKALANRNIQNQGAIVNANIDNRRDVGLAMASGALSGADRDAFTNSMNSRKVNTATI